MESVTRIKWTKDSYIKFVNSVHNNKYDYSLLCYRSLNNKIKIICPIHGRFEQFAGHHKKGKGCAKCAFEKQAVNQKDTTITFIEKAQSIHNYKFDFSETVYGKNAHDKVIIKCPVHGLFKISPNSFLTSKHGCQKCAREQGTKKMMENHKSSWKREDWINICKNKTAKLYIVKMFNNQECFYKIGITSKSKIERRFTNIPYNFKVIKIIVSNNAAFIYDLEKVLLKHTKHLKYKPKIKFQGHSECRKEFNIIECH